MRPAELLDHQADLLARLANPLSKQVWRQQVFLDFDRPIGQGEDEKATTDSRRGSAAAAIEAVRTGLRDAACFHVSPELTAVTMYAASQLEDLDRIDRTVLPTRAGFVRFEGGLKFREVRGRDMTVSWMVWCPVLTNHSRYDTGEPTEAILLGLFNDHREEPDAIYEITKTTEDYLRDSGETYERTFGRWGFIGVQTLFDGQRLGPAYAEPNEEKIAEIVADGGIPSEFTNPVRLAHAFWLLTGQTVASKVEAPLDRATRKRAERAGLPPRVTVITLRNLATKKTEGESLVEWSHRWVVRGFWRWQVCGPGHELAQEIEPGKYRARIWVAPFVKGPADKPLVVSEKVYAVRR